MIVRRIKRLNPAAAPQGQGELFTVYRYHAAFTDSTLSLVEAEPDHRRHAVVEQVISELKNGPFAHAPSGHFQANAAWLALAALAFNLSRAAGALAGTFHAKAARATIRDHLSNVPARLARSARKLTLHLPEHWPWQDAFDNLFAAVHAPPQAACRPIRTAREGPTPVEMWKSWADQRTPHAHHRPLHQQRPETPETITPKTVDQGSVPVSESSAAGAR